MAIYGSFSKLTLTILEEHILFDEYGRGFYGRFKQNTLNEFERPTEARRLVCNARNCSKTKAVQPILRFSTRNGLSRFMITATR